jgi:hypothetical protein
MEDFRVEVGLADGEQASALHDRLRENAPGVEGLQGVMVTRDDRHVFLYAETEPQAWRAEQLVRGLEGAAEIRVTRWHPVEEAWKDAAIPLPATPAEEAAEVAAREAMEAEEAEAEGEFDWHVIVHLPGRGEAVELARTLEAEGLAVRRRWRFVVVGVLSEDRAEELAARLREELSGADIRVEANLSDVERSALQFLPF